MISNIDKLTLGQLLGHSARKLLTIAEPLRSRSCVKIRILKNLTLSIEKLEDLNNQSRFINNK